MTNREKLKKEKKRNEKLLKMLNEEWKKIEGYKQIVKLYTAYIAIILNRMGATENKSVAISKTDVAEALDRYEARATSEGEGECRLYCVDLKECKQSQGE